VQPEVIEPAQSLIWSIDLLCKFLLQLSSITYQDLTFYSAVNLSN